MPAPPMMAPICQNTQPHVIWTRFVLGCNRYSSPLWFFGFSFVWDHSKTFDVAFFPTETKANMIHFNCFALRPRTCTFKNCFGMLWFYRLRSSCDYFYNLFCFSLDRPCFGVTQILAKDWSKRKFPFAIHLIQHFKTLKTKTSTLIHSILRFANESQHIRRQTSEVLLR